MKQIFRVQAGGKAVRDVIGLTGETGLKGDPLLVKVMESGRRIHPAEPLDVCRERCRAERNAFPQELLSLEKIEPGYRVELSEGLSTLSSSVRE